MTRKQEIRRFENETLALPPLRMVLLQEGVDRRAVWIKKTDSGGKATRTMNRRQVVLRLIAHLSQKEHQDSADE